MHTPLKKSSGKGALLALALLLLPFIGWAQGIFITNSHLGKWQKIPHNFTSDGQLFTYQIKNLLTGDEPLKVEILEGSSLEGTPFTLETRMPKLVEPGQTLNLKFRSNFKTWVSESSTFAIKCSAPGMIKSNVEERKGFTLEFNFSAQGSIMFWDLRQSKFVSRLDPVKFDYARGNYEKILEIRLNGTGDPSTPFAFKLDGPGKGAFSVYTNEISSKKLFAGKQISLQDGLKSVVIRYRPIGSANTANLTFYEIANPGNQIVAVLNGVANGKVTTTQPIASSDPPPNKTTKTNTNDPKKDPATTKTSSPKTDPKTSTKTQTDPVVVSTPPKKDPVETPPVKTDLTSSNPDPQTDSATDLDEDPAMDTADAVAEVEETPIEEPEEEEVPPMTKEEEIALLSVLLNRWDTLNRSTHDSIKLDFHHYYNWRHRNFLAEHSAFLYLKRDSLAKANPDLNKLQNIEFEPAWMYVTSSDDTIRYEAEDYEYDPETGLLVLGMPEDTSVVDSIKTNFNLHIALRPIYWTGKRFVAIDSSDVPFRPGMWWHAKQKPVDRTWIWITLTFLGLGLIFLTIRFILTRPLTRLTYLKEPQYLKYRSSRSRDIPRSKKVAQEISVDLNSTDHRLIELKFPEEVKELLTADVPVPEDSGFVSFLKKITFVKYHRFQAFYYSLRVEPIEEKLPSKFHLRDIHGLFLLKTEVTGDILANDHQDFLMTTPRFPFTIFLDPEEILDLDEPVTSASTVKSLQIPIRITEEPFWGFARTEEFVIPIKVRLKVPV